MLSQSLLSQVTDLPHLFFSAVPHDFCSLFVDLVLWQG